VIAVCEFYAAIRNIQSGLYAKRQIEQVWWDFIESRSRMFYARSGAGNIRSRVGGNLPPVFKRERKMSMPMMTGGGEEDVILKGDDGENRVIMGSPAKIEEARLPVKDEDEDEGGDLGGGMIDEGEDDEDVEELGEQLEESDLGGGLVEDVEETGDGVEKEEDVLAESPEGESSGDGSVTPIKPMQRVENPW
jgi:hypothetical protein